MGTPCAARANIRASIAMIVVGHLAGLKCSCCHCPAGDLPPAQRRGTPPHSARGGPANPPEVRLALDVHLFILSLERAAAPSASNSTLAKIGCRKRRAAPISRARATPARRANSTYTALHFYQNKQLEAYASKETKRLTLRQLVGPYAAALA